MCGIAGFVHFDPARPASAAVLERMTRTLYHRGPDGSGSLVCGNVALGHRRLAIIDLETGKQPLQNDDGSIAIVYNGEIYNYLELRAELLAAGYRFQTTSDTEVLVKGYEHWGLDVHEKLNGMWAFALWDRRRGRVVLSRDRLGEKPLHYASLDNSLIFGSELKAISAYGVPLAADTSVLEIYLTLGFLPGSMTFLKDVRKLEPGSYLILEANNVSHHRYWQLPAVPEAEMNRDSRGVCERFESLLEDSVRLRMRSDVDFGAFLSGGLDSSSIVSVMARVSDRPVSTFTIGFRQAELDERPLAREVAEHFGTQHHEEVVDYPNFEESISRVLDHTDEPFGDSSCLPTDRVAAYASRNVKMALSGDGGDEVLSGYNAYQSERLAGYLRWAPAPAVNGVSNLVRLAGRTIGGSIEGSASHAARIIRLSAVPFDTRLLQKAWADVALVRALLADAGTPQVPVDELLAGLLKRCPWRDPFYQLMYYNVTVTLPDDMLTKVDRMAMANSLEVRAPFLDPRLMELMAGVHKRVKLPHFTRKAVLRRTAARRLPRSVMRAKKRGFVAPLQSWLSEERGMALVQRAVRECPVPLRSDILTGVLEANRRGERNYGNFLWMVLILTEWLKRQTV